MDGKRTKEEIVELAKSNLDFVCEIADERISRNDESDICVITAVKRDVAIIGSVQRFYRDSIDYHPGDPELNWS